MKRTAAVDFGRRRIGLAVADPLGIAVRGLTTVVCGPDPAEALDAVAAALRAEEVGAVVVGLPLHADGGESEMSADARAFAARLGEALAVPVHLSDETLTTWEAEERIKARGIPLREAKRRGLLDQEAACCLLRAWLAERTG